MKIIDAHLHLFPNDTPRANCCGVKLYPGYSKRPLSDSLYEPVYRLVHRQSGRLYPFHPSAGTGAALGSRIL